MRLRTLTALGAGATATGVLLTTGIITTSLAVLVAPPLTPPAAADGLQRFDDCEELHEWYVDTTLPRVTAWGLDGGVGLAVDARLGLPLAAESSAADSGDAVGNNDSGTNVQEAGVDEPDVAKTDGSLVVHVSGRNLVLTDTTAGEPRELARLSLPKGLADPELLLVDDTVLVFGTSFSPLLPPMPGEFHQRELLRPSRPTAVIVAVDVSDPTAPRIDRTERIAGRMLSAREYDGTVRAVITTGDPHLRFVSPERGLTPEQARAQNRKIVRQAGTEAWLPSSTVDVPGGTGHGRRPLLDCTDVRHPETLSGPGTISILTFDAGSLDAGTADRDVTAITAGGELVYSSSDRLYVATNDHGWWGWPIPLADSLRPRKPALPKTEVHAFALDGDETTYVASGQLRGTVRDRWSFSEYDGHLRVATALGRNPWSPRENAVSVLAERDGDLVEVGRVGGMGIDEQIQSVRWFGDVAVVVTFRQIDPLYTLDLSDPTDPRVLGELKIRGFSAYLHPIGGDLLLGLGQDATRLGRTTGAQAATFDIGDLTDPVRLDTEGFAPHTELPVGWDARAFTYLPERRLALTPLQDWTTGGTKVAIFEIDEAGSISRTTTHRLGGWNAGAVRALPLDDGRVAVVSGKRVTLLDPA